jgi:hypothetical protein
VNAVRFSPCARTAWHSHSLGQTLHVTESLGVVATRGQVMVMRPGDTVHTPPGEEHWHGALPDHFMTHLAMWEGDDATWGDHVTEDEYRAPPSADDLLTLNPGSRSTVNRCGYPSWPTGWECPRRRCATTSGSG